MAEPPVTPGGEHRPGAGSPRRWWLGTAAVVVVVGAVAAVALLLVGANTWDTFWFAIAAFRPDTVVVDG